MKRIITLILAAAMLFGLSAAVSADFIGPYKPYKDAYVSNRKGTTFYYDDTENGGYLSTHIPYRTRVSAHMNFSGGFEESDYIEERTVCRVVWNGTEGFVPASDISLFTEKKTDEATEIITEKTTEATTAKPEPETKTTQRMSAAAELTTAEETTAEETTPATTAAGTTAPSTTGEETAQEAVKPAAQEKAGQESAMIKICVAAAAVVALTAGVTIALVRKKNGSK